MTDKKRCKDIEKGDVASCAHFPSLSVSVIRTRRLAEVIRRQRRCGLCGVKYWTIEQTEAAVDAVDDRHVLEMNAIRESAQELREMTERLMAARDEEQAVMDALTGGGW